MIVNKPIVIIDDDNDDRDMLIECLKEFAPDDVICFSDGKSALEYLITTTDDPCLIFSDINMPKMTGLQLQQNIDKVESLKIKSIPFIFLSTSATSDAVQQAFRHTVQGFFVKPTNIKKLTELLKAIYWYWNESVHPKKI